LAQRDAASRNRYLRRPPPAVGIALAAVGVFLGAALYAMSVNVSETPSTAADNAPTGAVAAPAEQAALVEAAVAVPQTQTPLLRSLVEDKLRGQGLAVEVVGSGSLVVHPDDDATFEFGSAKINRALRDTLEKIAAVLRDTGETNLRVAGHSDNIGREEVNRDLSQDRANAVVRYLVREGVPARRLRAEAMGFDQPKNPDVPPLNRRVEIYIDPVATAKRE
jgi:outer membrane protein OmpA-like peptidoglycan-associated protein